MAETIEVVISAILLFSVFLGLYFKFLKGKLRLPARLVPPMPAAPSRISRLLVWVKKEPGLAILAIVVMLIIAGIATSLAYEALPADKIYTFTNQDEFKNDWQVISGNWKVKNGYLEGGGKIALKNDPDAEVTKIRVVPANKEIVDVSVGIGSHYEFRYWQDAQTGGTTKLRIAVLYDGVRIPPGRDSMYKQNDAPRSVSIEKSTLGDDFSIVIGDSFGETETIGSVFPSPYKQYEPTRGIITISSSGIQLSRIEIKY